MKDNRRILTDFFAAEYRRMIAYVRNLIEDASDRDSEDIIQDVVTGILEKADITHPVENMAAYVYRSLKNRVIDMLRRKNNNQSLDAENADTGVSLIELLEDVRCDVESGLLFGEFREALFDSIDNLPDEQRYVIIMTEFEGFNFRNLSEKTGIPIGTLLSRKARGLERIRKELEVYHYLLEK